ncbi:MAG: HigA family addiction module antitoxin, partial [Gemmatimonadales bacterium]
LELSVAEAARQLGISYPRMHSLIQGKRDVTTDTALRLATVTGMSVAFWLQLQLDWDLWQLEHAGPPATIRRLRRLKKVAT